MTPRVLLTPVFHSPEDKRALETAFVLARRFKAHVDAVLVQPDPADTVPLIGEGVSAETIRRVMESAAAAIEERQKAARAVFDKSLAAHGFLLAEHPAAATGKPSASFREMIGRSEDVLAQQALLADLVVFGAARSDIASDLRAAFEAVLLRARQPMLLAPVEPTSYIGHNVAIAWNGTPESKSALDAALPFLEDAVAVHLLTATSTRTEADDLNAVTDYLAWHGIASEAVVVEPEDETVGEALMTKATTIGADLLVMGGYGHTRLRERILGGVTHHITTHPNLPILLAH
ncbi:MAG: universal stress protein [Alphaproteobacteria bacterium]